MFLHGACLLFSRSPTFPRMYGKTWDTWDTWDTALILKDNRCPMRDSIMGHRNSLGTRIGIQGRSTSPPPSPRGQKKPAQKDRLFSDQADARLLSLVAALIDVFPRVSRPNPLPLVPKLGHDFPRFPLKPFRLLTNVD